MVAKKKKTTDRYISRLFLDDPEEVKKFINDLTSNWFSPKRL